MVPGGRIAPQPHSQTYPRGALPPTFAFAAAVPRVSGPHGSDVRMDPATTSDRSGVDTMRLDAPTAQTLMRELGKLMNSMAGVDPEDDVAVLTETLKCVRARNPKVSRPPPCCT